MRIRGFDFVCDKHSKYKEKVEFTEMPIILLPNRATKNSAGYDFYSPIDISIPPQTKMTVWTDIKSYMQDGEVLMLYVRSSIGIKKGLTLANGTGVIDADY